MIVAEAKGREQGGAVPGLGVGAGTGAVSGRLLSGALGYASVCANYAWYVTAVIYYK